MKVWNDNDQVMDAEFNAEVSKGQITLVVEAYGGTSRTNPVNRERNPAVEILLARLGALGATLVDGAVDTQQTEHLPWDKRQLPLDRHEFPVQLWKLATPSQVRMFRLELNRATVKPGSRATHGGTGVRRIRLVISIDGFDATNIAALANLLGHRRLTDQPVGEVADPVNMAVIIVPVRPEQAEFRKALLEAYDGRCAVSGCPVAAALDAAHLVAFGKGGETHASNGLLLRADIHRLLDARLLGFEQTGGKWTVSLRRHLRAVELYSELHGRTLRPPKTSNATPREVSLRWCYLSEP